MDQDTINDRYHLTPLESLLPLAGDFFFWLYQNHARILALLSLPFIVAWSHLNIAIIDSNFCVDKLQTTNDRITIIQVAPTNKSLCRDLSSRRNHGYQVLNILNNEIQHHLRNDQSISLYLYNVFDEDGNHLMGRWENSISQINESKIDIVLMATSLPTNLMVKPIKNLLSPLVLVASGQVGNGIKLRTKLWPHETAMDNLFIIGSKVDSKKIERSYPSPGLLYQNKISAYYPEQIPGHGLKGSSLAVTLAVSDFIKKCDEINKGCFDSKIKKALTKQGP